MDSPRCLKCLESGLTGQTFKVCSRQKFKCGSCGNLFDRGDFEDIDFKWRSNPDEWALHASLIMENKRSEKGKKRILDIVEKAKS